MITEPPVELFTLPPEATTSTYTADGDGVAATTFRRQYTTHTDPKIVRRAYAASRVAEQVVLPCAHPLRS